MQKTLRPVKTEHLQPFLQEILLAINVSLRQLITQ